MRLRVLIQWVCPALLTGLLSCTSDEICLSNQHALQAGLYSARSERQKDTTLISASVYGVGEGMDSIYKDEAVSKLFLPLSFDSDTTAFVIDEGVLRDTIWFRHTKELIYISRNCGFTYDFTIDSIWYTTVLVDSVAVDKPGVKYSENAENVKMFVY